MLPPFRWGDGFDGVPMLHQPSRVDTIEVVERSVFLTSCPFADREDEVALRKNAMEVVIPDRLRPLSASLQPIP